MRPAARRPDRGGGSLRPLDFGCARERLSASKRWRPSSRDEFGSRQVSRTSRVFTSSEPSTRTSHGAPRARRPTCGASAASALRARWRPLRRDPRRSVRLRSGRMRSISRPCSRRAKRLPARSCWSGFGRAHGDHQGERRRGVCRHRSRIQRRVPGSSREDRERRCSRSRSRPLRLSVACSTRIVNYVLRTSELVVLDDAAQQGKYRSDPTSRIAAPSPSFARPSRTKASSSARCISRTTKWQARSRRTGSKRSTS